jgi:isopentenyldiphosphate isomerase
MKIIKNFLNTMIMHPKVYVLLISVVCFTILYMLLGDKHFSGVNFIKETVKKEVIKKTIKKELGTDDLLGSENFTPDNNYKKQYPDHVVDKQTEDAIEVVTKTATDELKEDELNPTTIDVSLLQQLFNRFYFSMNTACLLGYGDIYPVTNISKVITTFQSLFTISLIII